MNEYLLNINIFINDILCKERESLFTFAHIYVVAKVNPESAPCWFAHAHKELPTCYGFTDVKQLFNRKAVYNLKRSPWLVRVLPSLLIKIQVS